MIQTDGVARSAGFATGHQSAHAPQADTCTSSRTPQCVRLPVLPLPPAGFFPAAELHPVIPDFIPIWMQSATRLALI
ncbi:hypothetical protein GCM10010442_05430 [Kitasatospora kifunensis]|uniref:Uncharacterized protein n=1 Tax=Kitasatospora kifunensis TaxID=58351 RepID=A0A7W7QZ75_KITKI|nr:hypothetical protein [Kitasatospora kifunensis]